LACHSCTIYFNPSINISSIHISFLQYKVTISYRKARENQKLGSEEEAKRFRKLVQQLQAQTKVTITLLFIGGIDVIANMLIPLL